MQHSIQKSSLSLNDLSILDQGSFIGIFLICGDQNDLPELHKLIADHTTSPKFYIVERNDDKHDIIIDMSTPDQDAFIKTISKYTIEDYPQFAWLNNDQEFRLIVGVKDNDVVYGSKFQFTPSEVHYFSKDAHPDNYQTTYSQN